MAWKRRGRGATGVVLAFVVLAAGLVTSALLARDWSSRSDDEVAARLDAGASRAASAVAAELSRYEDLLRGVGALYEIGAPTERGLRNYLGARGDTRRLPGLQGVVLARPAGSRAPVAQSAGPVAWASRGSDLAAVPALVDALEGARTSGRPQLSGSFRASTGGPDGLALVLPLQGRGAVNRLRGWLVVRFTTRRILAPALAAAGSGVALSLRENADQSVLASSPRAAKGKVARTLVLSLYGRKWTLRARAAGSPAAASGRAPAWAIGAFGALLSLVVFALVLMLARSRLRAQRLAEASIERLLDLEERLRSLAATPAGIFRTDRHGHLVFVNARFEEIAGRSQGALADRHWTAIVQEGDRAQVLAAWREAAEQGREFTRQFQLEARVGARRWVECRIAPLTGARGMDTGWVGSLEDVTERRELEADLSQRALHDPLTGLANRVQFLDLLRGALAGGDGIAVLFIDLDRFKEVNDTLGHDAGDRVLVAVGRRLQGALRAADTVARFGGDEFTVLCRDVGSREEAVAAARRLSGALDGPFSIDGRAVSLSPSIGIAVASGPRTDAADLLRRADAAMYRAKARDELYELASPA